MVSARDHGAVERVEGAISIRALDVRLERMIRTVTVPDSLDNIIFRTEKLP